MSIVKKSAVLIALVSFVAFSFRPVPLQEVDEIRRGGDEEGKFKTRYSMGKSSHILPAVRYINFLLHAFRRKLVPLDVNAMKHSALEAVHGDNIPSGYEKIDKMVDLFGDLASWDAFEKYVEVVDETTHLFGRFLARNIISGWLAQHAYIVKRLSDNPEIHDEVIKPPIFLASYTRSGGTFIYQVLSDIFHEDLSPVKQFENLGGVFELPHAPLGQIEAAEIGLKVTKVVNPPLSLMHEWITPNDPEEDAGWYGLTFTGLTNAFLISSRHHLHLWLDESRHKKWHDLLETILKIKQFDDKSRRDRRAILKSPEHLIAMDNVVEKFPGAKIIVIDRDEVAWYKSSLAMTHQTAHLMVDNPNIEDILHFNDVVICAQMRARDRAVSSKNEVNVLHLEFSHLFNQTFEYAGQFAHFTGLKWDEEKQEHAKRVISKRLSWKKSKLSYQLGEFGIADNDAIQSRLDGCDEILKL